MEIIVNFLISIVLGFIGILPAFIIRLFFKNGFSKNIAILLMIISSLIGFAFAAVLYFVITGNSITGFSLITMFITAYFSFTVLLNTSISPILRKVNQNITTTNEESNICLKSKKDISKKLVFYIKKNFYKIILLILLFLCTIQLFQINQILKSFTDYNSEQLDKIESELDGFYSDWFRLQ